MRRIYKRTSREMSQSVKDKISSRLKGRKLSDETKKKISDGQRRAWAMIPQITKITNSESIDDNGKEN